jgi:hypothetical protein
MGDAAAAIRSPTDANRNSLLQRAPLPEAVAQSRANLARWLTAGQPAGRQSKQRTATSTTT